MIRTDRRSNARSVSRLRLAISLTVLGALVGGGCRKATSRPLANVVELKGAVEAERRQRWETAELGMALHAGDAVRTGADGDVRLKFVSGHELHLAPRSIVRLGLDPSSSIQVSVELGEADLEADNRIVLGTPRGTAHLSEGTRVVVRVDDKRARYEVVVGRAQFGEGDGGVTLGPGEGLALSVGSAEIERYRIKVGSAQVEPSAPAADAAPNDAAATVSPTDAAPRATQAPAAKAPASADLKVPAGESAVIHSHVTSVVVQLLALDPPCRQTAMVEVNRASGRAARVSVQDGQALLPLTAGRNRYRYLCGGKRVAEGALVVRQDDGHTAIPRSAPVNTIEADGRRYTLLYQNRLPALTFVWPNAPRTTAYTLHVEVSGRAHDYPATTPSLSLPSGTLVDGVYTWSFATAEGRHSPTTTAVIRFDNTAVTAQVESPRDGAASDGTAIEVAGIALLGSTVAVDGHAIDVDPTGRFKGQIPPPAAGARTIAVRFQHPHGGIHYYVRRLAGR